MKGGRLPRGMKGGRASNARRQLERNRTRNSGGCAPQPPHSCQAANSLLQTHEPYPWPIGLPGMSAQNEESHTETLGGLKTEKNEEKERDVFPSKGLSAHRMRKPHKSAWGLKNESEK